MEVEVFDTLRDAKQDPEVNMDLEQTLNYVQKAHDLFPDIIIELSYAQSDKAPGAKELYSKVRVTCPDARISTFGSTHNPKVAADKCRNMKAMLDSGAEMACIFGKTWGEQIEMLEGPFRRKMTKESYLPVIGNSVRHLKENGMDRVIYDAEHFFSGFFDDPEYAIRTLTTALDSGADTAVLCDTKGLIRPRQLEKILDEMFSMEVDGKNLIERYPDVSWGFHGHDDKRHAVSNTLGFVEKMDELGARSVQVQGTMNGTGERTGNADLTVVIPQLKEDLGYELGFKDGELTNTAHDIARIMALPLDPKKPYVGSDAGAHKAGMHLFSIGRGSKYLHTDLSRWGNQEYFLFTSMAGADFHKKNLEKYGIDVPKDDQRLQHMIEELSELEQKGYKIHKEPAEQMIFVNRFFGDKINMELRRWETQTGLYMGNRTSQSTIYGTDDSIFPSLGFSYDSEEGPVDSQFQVLKKTLGGFYPFVENVQLVDFKVKIAKPRGSKSSVLTYLTFADNGHRWRTQGLSDNILEATKDSILKGMEYSILRNGVYR